MRAGWGQPRFCGCGRPPAALCRAARAAGGRRSVWRGRASGGAVHSGARLGCERGLRGCRAVRASWGRAAPVGIYSCAASCRCRTYPPTPTHPRSRVPPGLRPELRGQPRAAAGAAARPAAAQHGAQRAAQRGRHHRPRGLHPEAAPQVGWPWVPAGVWSAAEALCAALCMRLTEIHPVPPLFPHALAAFLLWSRRAGRRGLSAGRPGRPLQPRTLPAPLCCRASYCALQASARRTRGKRWTAPRVRSPAVPPGRMVNSAQKKHHSKCLASCTLFCMQQRSFFTGRALFGAGQCARQLDDGSEHRAGAV